VTCPSHRKTQLSNIANLMVKWKSFRVVFVRVVFVRHCVAVLMLPFGTTRLR